MSSGRSGRRRAASGSTPAAVSLTEAGVDFVERTYSHEPSVTDYGDEAVAALGEPADRVFKTLVATESTATRPRLVVAVVPVSRQVDLKALAHCVHAKKLVMAQPADAERATGYVVGGISPFGQKHRLPTVLDESALPLRYILVSGGADSTFRSLRPTSCGSPARAQHRSRGSGSERPPGQPASIPLVLRARRLSLPAWPARRR